MNNSTTTWIQVKVPQGSQVTANGHSICPPIQWYLAVFFFATNFFASGLTIRANAGESTTSTLTRKLIAAICPAYGIICGLNTIYQSGWWPGRSAIETAKRSHALGQVVRTPEWNPRAGDQIEDGIRERLNFGGQAQCVGMTTMYRPPWLYDFRRSWAFTDIIGFYIDTSFKIHGGLPKLPIGYALAYVPHDAYIDTNPNLAVPIPDPETVITPTTDVFKVLVSFAHCIFSLWTLYLSKGDQVRRYGFLSADLTAVLFAATSFTNFVGNMFTPEYPHLYLLHTEIMDEAIRRDAAINLSAVVGRLITESILVNGLISRQFSGVCVPVSYVPSSREVWCVPSEITHTADDREEEAVSFLSETDVERPENEKFTYSFSSSRFPVMLEVEESGTTVQHQMKMRRWERPWITDDPRYEESSPTGWLRAFQELQVDLRDATLVPSCPQFRRTHSRCYEVDLRKPFYAPLDADYPGEIRFMTEQPTYRSSSTSIFKSTFYKFSNALSPSTLTFIQSVLVAFLPILLMAAISKFKVGDSGWFDVFFQVLTLITNCTGGVAFAYDIKLFQSTPWQFWIRLLVGCLFLIGPWLMLMSKSLLDHGICVHIP